MDEMANGEARPTTPSTEAQPGEARPAEASVEQHHDVPIGEAAPEAPPAHEPAVETAPEVEREVPLLESLDEPLPQAPPEPEPQPAPPAANEPLPIHHIGVAVRSIAEAMRFYGDKLGLDVVDRRELPDRQLRIAFVQAGNTLIELMEATDPNGTVARFVDRRGPGLHHICFGTTDIEKHLRDLESKGAELIDQHARPGAHGLVAFLQPDTAHGVLVELLEPGGEERVEAPY